MPPPFNVLGPAVTAYIGHLIFSEIGSTGTTSNFTVDSFSKENRLRHHLELIQSIDKIEFSESFKELKVLVSNSQADCNLLNQMYLANHTNRDLIDPIIEKYLRDNIEFKLYSYINDKTAPGSIFDIAVEYSSGLLNSTNLGLKSSPRKFVTSIWYNFCYSIMSMSYQMSAFIEFQRLITGGKNYNTKKLYFVLNLYIFR